MENFWNFNIGQVITIVFVILGGVGFVYTIRGRVDALSERMLSVERNMERLVTILIEQGRQNEQITYLREQITLTGKRVDQLTDKVMAWLGGQSPSQP